MKKRTFNALIAASVLSVLFIVAAMLAVFEIVDAVYADEPALHYRFLALIIYPLNGVPALIVGVKLIVFAVKARRERMREERISLIVELFRSLKTLFLIQAVYTFVSVTFIAAVENIGPPPLILITWFITCISLTLALLFAVLHAMVSNAVEEKTL